MTSPIPWKAPPSCANPLLYNILYKKSVERDLRALSKAIALKLLDQIEQKLNTTGHDTFLGQNCIVSQFIPEGLKGQFRGLRRMRVGDYRVIFAVFSQDVHVLRICHRKDAYREASFGPIDTLP